MDTESAVPDRRRGSPDRLTTPAEPLRLLIVEDDAGYRSYIEAMTQRLGFLVEVAEDGEAGVVMLERSRFDVAVIDQQMPRLDGFGFLARLRADEAHRWTYALMLTARDDEPSKLAALDAGFDDFLSKASSEPEIVATLAAAKRIAARHRALDVAARQWYGLATRDELTGLFNRRFFVSETARYLAGSIPLSVILFDLDGFKAVNDTWGHLAGDSVLREVAATLQRNTRPDDLIARYGGDEFVMVVPGLPHEEAEPIARRLAAEVSSARWDIGDAHLGISVTWGIASSGPRPATTVDDLLAAADRDLYRSKRARGTAAVVPADPPVRPAAPGRETRP